ncbi:hypothetical protein BU25DRAFT_93321 [Macroventuria anomochaeta]|uniref:Uncharacterized protein n=1 Tax=Macroventuria anomochaeta TaxID=301207 RepID=A0ACB6RXX9_9PLEO|nr:uncharacterized protein BU25DRAFT_93321 [Macroventuria anomochaeta]KAF2626731.1 hypothetical protein BU25DRAFT_93321 [Macroventuria anomochaeta]
MFKPDPVVPQSTPISDNCRYLWLRPRRTVVEVTRGWRTSIILNDKDCENRNHEYWLALIEHSGAEKDSQYPTSEDYKNRTDDVDQCGGMGRCSILIATVNDNVGLSGRYNTALSCYLATT